jgi:pre-mRNA-processing factor 40
LPELEEEKAFLHMVGQSGSTPLDLFRDVILRFEEDLKDKLVAIQRTVMQNNLSITSKTTFAEFEQSVNSLGVFFDVDALRFAFDRLVAEQLVIEKEMKKREERRLKRTMDDFKSVLKRATPPICLKTPWAEAAALVSHKPEYTDLPEEHRLAVFEKCIARLAEKAKDDEGSDEKEDGMIVSDDEKRRKSSKKEKKKHRRRRSESPSSEDEDRKAKKKVLFLSAHLLLH